MKRLRGWMVRLGGLFRREQQEQELADEMESHLALHIEDNLRSGMTPEEARRDAILKLGGVEQTKQAYRERRTLPILENLLRDVRYALRQLQKSPGFAMTAILTLALGIGANTAIFTLMDAALLRSLPVKQPDRLFILNWKANTWPDNLTLTGYFYYEFSYPMFERFQKEHRIFSSVFGFAPLGMKEGNVAVGLHGHTTAATGSMVTGGYFAGLGVAPVLGRAITESDARQGAAPVAVISYGYWQRVFAGSTSALGQHITLNAQPYTIVGVAPPKFFGLQAGRQDDIWVPVVETKALHPWASNPPIASQSMFTSPQWWWLTVLGRLQPGVTQQQAVATLTPVLQSGFQDAFGPLKPENQPSMEIISGSRGLGYLEDFYTEPLHILMGIVALLLLATCAGLATLLLARAAARCKEISIRMATGATRARVIRQLLTESVLLSGCGGGLGLLLAFALAHSLATLIASGDYPLHVDVSPDPLVLAFTAAASVLTGILFGLAPAWRATRVDLVASLKETTGTYLGEVHHRFTLGKVLIVLQVAASMLLLVGAGYMLRSLQKLEHQNIGIARDHRLVFSIDPTVNGYNNRQQLQIYQTVLSRLQSLPGVKSATTVNVRLISNWFSNGNVDIEGYRPADRNKPLIFFDGVGPQFLETTGIRLLVGRDINDHDTPTSPKVAIINQDMAEKYFGGRNPIGLHITRELGNGKTMTYQIVGICANAKYTSLRDPIAPTFYYPDTQQHSHGMTFYLRTYGDPNALVPDVRHVVHDLDPSLLVKDIRSQSDQIDESIVPERMLARLTSFFGALALPLAAIGLNGTLAYAVNRRSQEIGIRMALGAGRGQVVRLVVVETIVLVCLGIAVGIPVAIACAELVSSQLYGIQRFDLPTLIGASAVLLLTAVLSGYFPAARAASIDPMRALRAE